MVKKIKKGTNLDEIKIGLGELGLTYCVMEMDLRSVFFCRATFRLQYTILEFKANAFWDVSINTLYK